MSFSPNKLILVCLTLFVGVAPSAQAQVRGEYLITNYGAKGNDSFDNAPIINDLINRLPDTGGTVVIPHGDFRINSPIVIRKNRVTLRGLGRGSKVIVAPGVTEGILLPNDAGRIEGVLICDLHVAGTDWNVYQHGVFVDRPSDFLQLRNVAVSNLHKGFFVRDMDGGRITGCHTSQCESGLHMVGGSNSQVTKSRFTGFSAGIAVELASLNRLQFTNNNIGPDGYIALWLRGAENCNISGNMILTFYTGCIQVDGNMNAFSGNNIHAVRVDGNWLPDPRGRDGLWGLIQITGNDVSFTSSSIISDQPDNDIRVNVLRGERNALRSLTIAGGPSTRKVNVDPATSWTRITHCGWPQEINLNGTPTARVFYDP